MSFVFPTNASQVQAFAGALYGVQVGSTTMAQVNADIAANGGLAATLNSYYAASFGGATTASVANTVATNLGLTGDALTSGVSYLTAQLNAAAPGARGAVISSIVNLFSNLASDATFGAAATAWNAKVAAAVAYTGTHNVAIGTVVAPQGSVFTLTAGLDNIIGTAGNDTFNAGVDSTTGSVSNTWTALDAINGGAGTDTLNINAITAFTAPAGATVTGVENANIRSAVAVTANTTTWTGLTTLNSTAVGSAALTAAATTDVVSTITESAGAASTVTGGNNVTVNVTGTTAGATQGVTITTPAGNVVVNTTGATGGVGAVNVTGGDTVTVNTKAANLVNTTLNLAPVGVTGDAGTTVVTVNNPAMVIQAATVAGVSLGGAVTVADAADATGKLADTINTVSLTNFGNSTVASSALNTVNLTGGATLPLASGTLGLSSQSLITPAAALTINSAGGFMGAISTTGNANYKSIDINSSAKTTIADLTTAAATTTLNFTGSADTTLTANTLSATLVDINVTGTGGVTLAGAALGAGVDFDGGAGNDTITIGATTKSITMGEGNDLVIITAALGASGSVDGGAGYDIVGTIGHTAGFAAAINAVAATGFEAIGLATPAAGTASAVYDMTGVTLKTIATTNTVTLGGSAGNAGAGTAAGSTGATGGTSTARIDLDGLAVGSSLIISHSMSVNGGVGGLGGASGGTGGAGGAGGILLDLTPAANTGSDAITITLAGVTLSAVGGAGGAAGTGGTAPGGAGGAGGKAIVATNFDTINIISNASADGLTTANTITANGGFGGAGSGTGATGATGVNGASIEMAAGGTINISGAADLNLGHVGGATATIGFNVNASAFTGNLTVAVGGTSSNVPSTLTSGSGNDILTGSGGVDAINGGAGNDVIKALGGNDVINGGAGNDTITGGDNTDLITLGEGTDTVIYGASTEVVLYTGSDTNAANIEKITDFNVADDTIQLTVGATFGVTLAGTTGIRVNEGATAPFQITAGLATISALTLMMETVATGVASTTGAAGAATGLQAYVFQTAAGNGPFDGKTFLVVNDGTASLAATDVIIELTGMVGTLTAADFTVVAPVV